MPRRPSYGYDYGYDEPSYPRGGDRILDLMMQHNRERQATAGQGWAGIGEAVAGIGQEVGGILATREAKKKLAARDIAWDADIDKWKQTGDTVELQKRATKRYGPDGPKHFEGVISAAKLDREVRANNLEENRKRLGTSLKYFDSMPNELKAKHYQDFARAAAPTLQALGMPLDSLPAEWSADYAPQIGALRQAITGEKPEAPVRVAQGEALVDLKTGKPVYQAKPKPEPPPKTQAVGGKIMQWNPATNHYDIPLGASEAALTRQAKAAAAGKGGDEEVQGYLDALGRGDMGLEGVPPKYRGAVVARADKQGVDTRTTKQREIDSTAQGAMASLDQIEEQAKGTMTATSGPMAAVAGRAQSIGNALGLAPQTRLWEAQTAKLSQIARQLGEKGNLSDSDIKRIQGLLPGLTDPVDIRDKKLADIREIFEAAFKGKVSKHVTFRPSGTDDEPTR